MKTILRAYKIIRIFAIIAAGTIPFNASALCNIYMGTSLQTIDGFGACSAWCGRMSAAKNQALFGTLGFSLWRVQIMDDINGATDNRWSDEANNAAAAHSYGAKVFGTDWGAAVKGWDTNGTVWIKPQYFQAQAEWLALAGQYHHLDWVSPANEPDYGWQQWNAGGYSDFTTKFGSIIGFPLIEAESFNFGEPFSQSIVNNPNVANYVVPIAAGHGYGATPSVHSAEIAAGKRVWQTEYSPPSLGQDNIAESIAAAQVISQYMNNQFNAFLWWWMYNTDTNLNFVDESGLIHKNGYMMGQFAKWIRPGSTCVSATYAPQANVNVTAYNVNGSVVIVAVNANNGSVNQQFNIFNSSAAQLEGYQTSASQNMADIGAFALSGGSFTVSLPAQSITTFVQTNAAAPSLPSSSWTALDIGSPGIVGSVTYTNTVVTNGVFTLTASGTDIWNTSDQFRFVYATNSVNCTITARVSAEQSTNPLAKAGVMIRDSLNANAANAFIGLTASNGVTWQFRSSDGGGTSSNSVAGLSAPYWIQLVENGSTITGNYSTDGITWTQLGTATISMGSAAYAGLAFCNNGNTSLGTATFDNVSTPGWPIPPPATPVGLTATAGIEQAILSWQPVIYATTFSVRRATVSGGPYATVATVRGTSYWDTGLVGGTTYYYVVSATNSAGQSAATSEVSATPTANIMSPWQAQDIGTVGSPVFLPGSESFTNGVFTLTASGADIWNAADGFRFVYVPTNSTSFAIVARVTSLQNIDPWSKAGVMIRDSLNANAANAFIALSANNGVTWQYRTTDGDTTANTAAPGLTVPYWVKLARTNNSFTAYRSLDGVNWTQMGTAQTISMPSTVYVGLAVTAHNNTLFSTSTFDNVSVPGFAPPTATTPTSLTAAPGNEQVALKWFASSATNTYNIYRSTTNGGPYAFVANIATTNYNDIQLASGTTYYYVVTAVSTLAGESPNSVQVNAATTVTVPTPWVTQDIGSPAWGSASFANGVFTLNGAGADIWNNSDSFRFVYITTNGANFTMVARVASLQNVNEWSKAGIMIRDSLNAGAENALIAVTPNHGVTFQYRLSDNGNSANSTSGGHVAPYWVMLVRNGTTFTGSCSPDGMNWTQVGSATLTNITKAYVGLAVTSHANPSLCTATFDNVTGLGWPPSAINVSAAAVSTSQINLTWTVLANATSYNVKRSTVNGGPYSTVASGMTVTNFSDTNLASGTMYYYVVSAIISGVETSNSAPASAATFSTTYGSLAHRYSFLETSGNTTADSVGGPVWNGTLPNGGTFSGGGQLTLSPGSTQYVALPAGIVGGLSNLTVMAWVKLNTVSNWARIFDFGNSTTVAAYATMQNATTTNLYFAITTNSYMTEQPVFGNFKMSTGTWHQVAVTLTNGTGTLYLDGAPVGTNTALTLNPVVLGTTTNNYIGKSQWPNDPYFNGQIEEFRIYNVGLSPAQVAATYALGSGLQLSTNNPVIAPDIAGGNLTLVWPLANAGYALQVRTNLSSGNWMTVTSPPPQIVGTNYRFTLPATNATLFYRLQQ